MKDVLAIVQPPEKHWVGNGFWVRSLFSYQQDVQQYSPFLLLDYAETSEFVGDGRKRGVGEHPHRGFETVTIVYQGEVSHRDSTGKGGIIKQGDVQWMTAGAGIMHEEFHSPEFSRQGGNMQMVQLWVNLPAKNKLTAPNYQALKSADFPQLDLPNDAGTLRLIAGEYNSVRGPANTFSLMNVWDMRLFANAQTELDLPEDWTAAIVVLEGEVSINQSAPINAGQMAMLSREQTKVNIQAHQPSLVLILNGQPIDEPVVGHGPFVMNTQAEIIQAFEDFQQGRFARIDGN
ncbi:pirin family protein [Paraglaciecola aestuariivivens]